MSQAARSRRCLLAAGLGAPVAIVLMPLTAWTQCQVNTTADSGTGSLRNALSNCTSGTITFQSGITGTISLKSTLAFSSSVATTVTGPGAAKLAITGGGAIEALDVIAGSTLKISGVTIEKGLADQTPTPTLTTGVSGTGASPSGAADYVAAAGISGGGIWNDGTLTLQDCVVTGNSAPAGIGGAIYNSSTGVLTINDCTISDNSAGQDGGTRGDGGGLFNAGTATITGSTFSGNIAAGGGQGSAIYNLGSATMTNSTVTGNESTDSHDAGGGEGAIYSDGQMHVTNCTIADNTVGGAGSGGGMLQSVASSDSPAEGTAGLLSAPLTPEVSSIDANGTVFTDPCLTRTYAQDTNGTLTNIVALPPLNSGNCQLGSAIWTPVIPDYPPSCSTLINPCQLFSGITLNSTTPFVYTVLQANVPENETSYIYFNLNNTQYYPYLDQSGQINPYIVQCSAANNTGSFYIARSSQIYRYINPDGSISNPTAFEGLFALQPIICANWYQGPLSNLIAESETLNRGYYIKYVPSSNVSGTNVNRLAILIVDSVNSGCVAGTSPADCTIPILLINVNVIPSPGSSLANTIVAGNTAANYPDAAGVFTDLGGNLIGAAGSEAGNSGFTVSTLLGTLASPQDPLLLALGNYGGPTQTMLPQPFSPAIGAGITSRAPSTSTTDQRGFPRIVSGHVDIGADEFQGTTLRAIAGTPQSTMINTQFPTALTANLVESGSGTALGGQTVNFAAPGSGASCSLSSTAPITDSSGKASTTATANGNPGSYNVTASFENPNASYIDSSTQFALTNVVFAGQPGEGDCHGKSVAALSKQYGTLAAAASALGYPTVKALQTAIKDFCGEDP